MRKRSIHVTTVLELLKTLPDTPERIQAVGKAGSRTASAGTWTVAEADHPMLTEPETCFRQAIADSISVSLQHHMLKDTTVASGKWEGMRKDAHCDWMSGDHGYFPQGPPKVPRRSQG